MNKWVGLISRVRKNHPLSSTVMFLIGFTIISGNYIAIVSTDGVVFEHKSIELISDQTQDPTLNFIPTNIIRDYRFPIRISNEVDVPVYYNASWDLDLIEISNTGGDLYWIELDGSDEGEGSIQFYQEQDGMIVEFSDTHNIAWSIPAISNELPVKIDYEYYSKNSYLVQYEYWLTAAIFEGYANIDYDTMTENGPIVESTSGDGLIFPTFADLLVDINFDEARRFQTWIYQSDITAYDGGINKFTMILWWDDGSFNELDYHLKMEGDAIFTMFSHNEIRVAERAIYDASLDSLNNAITLSTNSETSKSYSTSLYWFFTSFILIRVYDSKQEKRIR